MASDGVQTGVGADIGFRPLRRTDLVLLRRWLNAGAALEWYGRGMPTTREEVAAKYLPKIRGEVPTQGFVIRVGRASVGYIQTYRYRDWPDAARKAGIDEDAAGVDLFLGEPAFLRRGLGPKILERFLEEVVFPTTGCRSCAAGPSPANRAAIRAFEKAGFRPWKTVGAPGDPDAELLMRREKR